MTRVFFFGLLVAFLDMGFGAVPAAAQDMIGAETLPCTSCHNETTMLVSKQAQLQRSPHGHGDAYLRGTNANCSGCHGAEEAKARIEAGLMPHDASLTGVANVSPYTCRTCHDIHTTYTLEDFSIVGEAKPVELEMSGTIFDAGAGNLCANCHQSRNALPEAENGQVEITTTRFGPHHGIEAQVLLGEGGMNLRSRPGYHYKRVDDSCVNCHMGPIAEADPSDPLPALARNHTFEPQVAYCRDCHDDIEDFDYGGIATEIQGLIDEVRPLLIASGIMDGREGRENRSVEGTYPEDVAAAMWNYMVVIEDGSKGMHNPDWSLRLLESARDSLQ